MIMRKTGKLQWAAGLLLIALLLLLLAAYIAFDAMRLLLGYGAEPAPSMLGGWS